MLRHLASLGQQALLHPHSTSLQRRAAATARSYLTRTQPATHAISAPLRTSEPAAVPFLLPARPVSVPGSGVWQLYLRSLQTRPLLTKSLTSFSLTMVSDSVAQLLGGMAGYSLWRAVRLALYSASIGTILGHFWHRFLDANCCPDRPTSIQAVGTKLALDQLLFTPVMTAAYLAFLKAEMPALILPFLGEKLLSTVLAGYTVWPAVNIITFRFIPQDLRVAFCGAVGLFWGTYMSLSCVNDAQPCTQVAVRAATMTAADCTH